MTVLMTFQEMKMSKKHAELAAKLMSADTETIKLIADLLNAIADMDSEKTENSDEKPAKKEAPVRLESMSTDSHAALILEGMPEAPRRAAVPAAPASTDSMQGHASLLL